MGHSSSKFFPSLVFHNYSYCADCDPARVLILAAPQGFEPQSAGPEPAVLPIERKGNFKIIYGHTIAVKRQNSWPGQAKVITIQEHRCGVDQWSPAVSTFYPNLNATVLSEAFKQLDTLLQHSVPSVVAGAGERPNSLQILRHPSVVEVPGIQRINQIAFPERKIKMQGPLRNSGRLSSVPSPCLPHCGLVDRLSPIFVTDLCH